MSKLNSKVPSKKINLLCLFNVFLCSSYDFYDDDLSVFFLRILHSLNEDFSALEIMSAESTSSDTEYADHVHECLKFVPIYKEGAFSCSSLDENDFDDNDDEDVKRILAEHGQSEPGDCEFEGFSSVYKAAAETVMPSSEKRTIDRGGTSPKRSPIFE